MSRIIPAQVFLIFVCSTAAAQGTLGVLDRLPGSGAIGVRSGAVIIQFDGQVAVASLTDTRIGIESYSGTAVAVNRTYDSNTSTVTLSPTSPLAPLSNYRVWIRSGSTGVTGTTGAQLASDVVWTFTTGAPNGLAAAWSFGEGSGTTTLDDSGNGNTASIEGAQWSSGAITFDGVDDRLQVADADALDVTSAITLSASVKLSSFNGPAVLMQKAASSGQSYGLVLTANQKIAVRLALGAVSYEVEAPAAFPLNTTKVVTATYDGSYIRLYVDSTEVANASASGELTQTNEPLWIGGGATDGYYAGTLDNIRLYAAALSASEVSTVTASAVAPQAPPAPLADPRGGVYDLAPVVTLSAVPGATIRYTLNGSTPGASSPLYTGPVLLPSAGGTLKARAFLRTIGGGIVTEIYTVDNVAPNLSAAHLPAAIGDWHNTPTTVRFTCTDNIGISLCSEDSVVTTQGIVTRTGFAIDQVGNFSTYSALVKTDFTLPVATISSPADGASTSDTTIAVTGVVSDALSGLSSVKCNAEAAVVQGGQFQCTVPLRPGRNGIVVVARDAASNVVSVSRIVNRTGASTTLQLSPTTQSIMADEEATLALKNEFGATIAAATWTSSDTNVVTLSSDDPPVVTGVGTGTATISATMNGLSAEATVTVVAGTAFPSGVDRWTVGPPPGYWGTSFMPTNRVDPSVPPLFAVDGGESSVSVRALSTNGETSWVAPAPAAWPLMADSFGGLVAALSGVGPSSEMYGYANRYRALARFAGPAGAADWQFDAIDSITGYAQAPDGTMFVLERYNTGLTNYNGVPIIDSQLVVIDGGNGRVKTRHPLARELRNHQCAPSNIQAIPETIGPIVGNDGYGYLLVRGQSHQRTGCGGGSTVVQELSVTLLRVSPLGDVMPTTIFNRQCVKNNTSLTVCDQAPALLGLVPDGAGGLLARASYTVSAFFQFGPQYGQEVRVTRVADGTVQYDLPVAEDEGVFMVGDGGIGFGWGHGMLRAIDLTNWTTQWSTANPNWVPVTATAEGGVVMRDLQNDGLVALDAAGSELESDALGAQSAYQAALGLWVFADDLDGTVKARHSLAANESKSTFGGGIGTAQNAPRVTSFTTRESAALAAIDYIYKIGEKSQWEYGGLICAVGSRFEWSRMVTDMDQSSVFVPDSLCPVGTLRAHFHTHPTKEPSGAPTVPGDINGANTHPGIPYYLRGRRPNTNSLMTVKYWNGAGRTALQNLCVLQDSSGNEWAPYTPGSGAVCLTPVP